jgi:hypothetical protein
MPRVKEASSSKGRNNMEEQKKPVVEAPAEVKPAEKPAEAARLKRRSRTSANAARPNGNPSFEPHGSRTAGRPGDRKFGDHKGRPGERRGGRGGFRRDEMSTRSASLISTASAVLKGWQTHPLRRPRRHRRWQRQVWFRFCKSGEVPDAIKKSLTAAKKEMYTIHVAKGNTIAHPK